MSGLPMRYITVAVAMFAAMSNPTYSLSALENICILISVTDTESTTARVAKPETASGGV